MSSPAPPGLSMVVESFFGAAADAFGIPERFYYDNSREIVSVVALESFVQKQVEIPYGVPRRRGEDTDA